MSRQSNPSSSNSNSTSNNRILTIGAAVAASVVVVGGVYWMMNRRSDSTSAVSSDTISSQAAPEVLPMTSLDDDDDEDEDDEDNEKEPPPPPDATPFHITRAPTPPPSTKFIGDVDIASVDTWLSYNIRSFKFKYPPFITVHAQHLTEDADLTLILTDERDSFPSVSHMITLETLNFVVNLDDYINNSFEQQEKLMSISQVEVKPFTIQNGKWDARQVSYRSKSRNGQKSSLWTLVIQLQSNLIAILQTAQYSGEPVNRELFQRLVETIEYRPVSDFGELKLETSSSHETCSISLPSTISSLIPRDYTPQNAPWTSGITGDVLFEVASAQGPTDSTFVEGFRLVNTQTSQDLNQYCETTYTTKHNQASTLERIRTNLEINQGNTKIVCKLYRYEDGHYSYVDAIFTNDESIYVFTIFAMVTSPDVVKQFSEKALACLKTLRFGRMEYHAADRITYSNTSEGFSITLPGNVHTTEHKFGDKIVSFNSFNPKVRTCCEKYTFRGSEVYIENSEQLMDYLKKSFPQDQEISSFTFGSKPASRVSFQTSQPNEIEPDTVSRLDHMITFVLVEKNVLLRVESIFFGDEKQRGEVLKLFEDIHESVSFGIGVISEE